MWFCPRCRNQTLKKRGLWYVWCSTCHMLMIVDETAMIWYAAEARRHEAGRSVVLDNATINHRLTN